MPEELYYVRSNNLGQLDQVEKCADQIDGEVRKEEFETRSEVGEVGRKNQKIQAIEDFFLDPQNEILYLLKKKERFNKLNTTYKLLLE